jgi:hypothetical protein
MIDRLGCANASGASRASRRYHPACGPPRAKTVEGNRMADEVRGEASLRRTGLSRRLFDGGWVSYVVGSASAGILFGLVGLGLTAPVAPILAVPAGLLSLGVYLAPLLIAVGWLVGRPRKLGASRIAVERDVLRVEGANGKLEMKREDIVQGVLEHPSAMVVEDREGRQLTLDVGGAEGAELLATLGLDPSHRRFAFRWRRRSTRFWTFLAALFVTSGVATLPMVISERLSGAPSMGAFAIMMFSMPWLVAELTSRWASAREITVGLDGVTARRRGEAKTLRFADVKNVRATDTELVVEMNDGRTETLLADPDDPALRAAIESRIAEARAAAKEHEADATPIAALLDRAGRSLGEWRSALARVLTAATGFRDAQVSPEEIAAVVEDPTASAEQRLAAAVALGATGDAEHRARVRVAADACAVPKLRVALEAAAGGAGDDDALFEAALAEAEEDEQRERMRE